MKKSERKEKWEADKQRIADEVGHLLLNSGIVIPLIQRAAMKEAMHRALEEARNWKPDK